LEYGYKKWLKLNSTEEIVVLNWDQEWANNDRG
jgi:hypothetical protein